jgi:Flp pilus assembly pilin Flp
VEVTTRKVVMMVNEAFEWNDESGQTMAEYAVVIGVITLTIVTTFSLLSGAMNAAFQRTVEIVSSAF